VRVDRFPLLRVALALFTAVAITSSALPATAATSPAHLGSTDLGKVIVSAKGRTTCKGSCASTWPPVIVSSKAVGKIDGGAAKLATITRSDGRLQLTVNGRPVYTFTGDSAKGDVNGQGVDGFGARWWVVGPNGTRITTIAGDGQDPVSDPNAPPDYGY
jgi:predicted lipoprotein with Yx(FWY)xxD motif